ncbi:LOW QUALITY PROTEIN: mitotic spindle assembly checkpoint protein MAD2A-like [Trichechus inunguis]
MTKCGDDWGHFRRSCSGEGGRGRRGRAGGRCEGRDQETRRACAKGTTAAATLLLKRVAGKCCRSHARLRLWARRLQLTREQGITLRGSAGIVAEFFSKSSSPRPELGRAEPRPSRRPAAPPRRLGARMARSGPSPSPRAPAPSARAEESAERRMPAPRSGRGANAFGINSILYQPGTYPSETFTRVQKYGLTVLVTTDRELIKYLNNVVEQLKVDQKRCLVMCCRLVIQMFSSESGEVLERWQFHTECDKTAKDDSAPREKSQIRSVIRQITATVTFLPLLEVSCSFDLRIYTDKDLVVPEKWEESGPQFITNSEEARLCSFNTTIHKVNSMVVYKIPVND